MRKKCFVSHEKPWQLRSGTIFKLSIPILAFGLSMVLYQFLHWLMACLGNSFACSQSLCFTNQDWNLDVTRRNQTWNTLFVFDVRFNAAGYLATLATCSRANRWTEAGTWAIWTSATQILESQPSLTRTEALEMTERTQPHREGYAPGRLEDWMIGSVWKMSLRLHVCYGKLTYCNSS